VTKEQYVDERYTNHLHYWATLGLGAGSLVILMLIPLDAAAIPAQFRTFLFYRLVTAGILFLLYLVNRKRVKRGLQNASVVAAGAVVAAMLAAMVRDFHGHESPYFAGFILVAIFVAGIIPISFGASVLAGLIIYSLYLAPILAYDTITNPPYFLSANILMLASITSLLLIQYLRARQTLNEFGLEYNRRAAEEALLARERQLVESQRMARIGSWERNLSNDRVVWSKEMFRILGLNPETDEATFKALLEIVHPDDREKLKKALKDTMELRKPYAIDCRIALKDGGTRTIHAQGELVLDSAGKPILLRGTAQDITERKRMEHLLRESEAKLRNINEVIGEGIYVLDGQGRLTFMNPEAEKLLGWTEAELLGREVHDVIHFQKADRTPLPAAECPVHRAISSGGTFRNEEDVFTRKDGTLFPVAIVATPLREDGRIVGSVAAFQDISERKKVHGEMKLLNELLARQATTDPLTGISNRLKFNDMLSTELRRAKRFGTPLSLIMFDIDHFKGINDSFGHHAGDQVLRELTGLVAQSVRAHDLFARWGGEEFMIMATNITADNARLYAEKLRLMIEHREFSGVRRVTCSFGVAQLASDDNDDSFTRRADDALYRAKAQGRNRVELA